MSDHVEHCPFLNRADGRCAEHFQLDHLGHAFKYCFDEYHSCPVYAQQLAERQERRAAVAGAVKHATSNANLVTVSVPTRYAQPQRAA